MVRILVVDCNHEQLEAVSKYFSNSRSIMVVDLLDNIEKFDKSISFDYIFINIMLNGLDGFRLVSTIGKMKLDSKVIVYGEYITSDMFSHLRNYNPNYIINGLIKPVDMEEIINSTSIKNEINEDSLDIQVTNLLHTLGVPSHVKGFNFIRDGIKMLYNDRTYIGAITKRLYPDIAKLNNSTYTKVERTIRHAIEVAWNRGDYEKMEEIFGNSVDFDRAKPTNSEFLVTLADRIKLENKI